MKVYQRVFQYIPEKKWIAILAVLIAAVGTVLNVYSYELLYQFLKSLLLKQEVVVVNQMATQFLIMIVSGVVLIFVATLLTHMVAFALETSLRKRGIDCITKCSAAFFDQESSGKIRKTIDDNAALTHMSVAHLIPDLTSAILTPILIIGIGFRIATNLGIVLVVLFVLGFGILAMMMGNQTFMKLYLASLEEMSSKSVEYVRGMPVYKIFDTDVKAFHSLYDAIQKYAKYALDYSFSCRFPYIVFQLVFLALVAIVIGLIAIFDATYLNQMEVLVNIIMLFILSGLLFTSTNKVMYVGMNHFQAKHAMDLLEELYTKMEKDAVPSGTIEDFDDSSIHFEHVTFGYEDLNIFENFSVELPGNRMYALVGPSGGGKSTFAKLTAGMYRLKDGDIKLGSHSLFEYSEKALEKNIAFVFQDSKLFPISIYENVAIGNPNATKEEVMHALHLACCDELLAKLENKEETIIGTKGIYLSGGEMQRIAIARAILKDSKIVILDEACAATDPENEYELQRAFTNLMRNKTVLMIAHRMTAIQNVDEILFIEQGKIQERGSFHELMEKEGKTYQFYTMYQKANEWRVYEA